MTSEAHLLGRLEAQVDRLLDLETGLRTLLKAHDERISSLEHGRTWLLGVGAAFGAVFSGLLAVISLPFMKPH